MRFAGKSLLVLMTLFFGNAAAQSIFNVQPAQPQSMQQRPVPGPASFAAPAVKAQPASQAGQPASSTLVDPKVMAQFDQMPNESNDAYRIRLKALSQKTLDEMEKTLREHNARMKALAPK